jgi:hypothetical protein
MPLFPHLPCFAAGNAFLVRQNKCITAGWPLPVRRTFFHHRIKEALHPWCLSREVIRMDGSVGAQFKRWSDDILRAKG